ncbi:hypothetical protein QVD17_31384 [Tagetes erecta]|uniref:VWFA domain-containing protein n=1 Tax=Tagetes erecta TaxID=13708 RepID=A0AAD8K6X1_TARER|nr:hypothetical protein QVD17_31384 [Tagetes erecta]
MRSIVSSSNRLSIVAFASYSKRLLPLRRMTTSGRRSVRRIVEAMAVIEGSSNSKDAVKKAVKVLEKRRKKNPVTTVILLFDITSSVFSSTRYYSQSNIPIHSLNLNLTSQDNMFAKCIGNLLNVVFQDLRLELGFASGSSPAVIARVYSSKQQPIVPRYTFCNSSKKAPMAIRSRYYVEDIPSLPPIEIEITTAPIIIYNNGPLG